MILKIKEVAQMQPELTTFEKARPGCSEDLPRNAKAGLGSSNSMSY